VYQKRTFPLIGALQLVDYYIDTRMALSWITLVLISYPSFMDKARLHYLLQQYIKEKATREEEEELFARLDLLLKFTYSVTLDADQAWQKLWADMQATGSNPP
jgi:hypothetical protein